MIHTIYTWSACFHWCFPEKWVYIIYPWVWKTSWVYQARFLVEWSFYELFHRLGYLVEQVKSYFLVAGRICVNWVIFDPFLIDRFSITENFISTLLLIDAFIFSQEMFALLWQKWIEQPAKFVSCDPDSKHRNASLAERIRELHLTTILLLIFYHSQEKLIYDLSIFW